MKQLAIQAENISKQYRLGQVGTGTLSHDLNRFWHKIRGNEDPYLKIGEANDRSQKAASDYVWSLRDINFEIEQGDAVGIIGRNGAGKSTLLKLLSKVTKPTTGHFKVNGRIASLLEVGTGFHPEMTGRENIYLNGAILGMRRHEITRKFDEIVDFSGVGGYIDTPVKRYSSGMYVRLAFAVAAHLESEILIVDEVLAVGDAEFQKKCLGKMGDVSKGEGRTVLFVSHNMAAVKSLCTKGIVLKNGLVGYQGDTDASISYYLGGEGVNGLNKRILEGSNYYRSDFNLKEVSVKNMDSHIGDPILEHKPIEIHTSFELKVYGDYHITYHLFNELGEALFSFYDKLNSAPIRLGENKIICKIPGDFLQTGNFSLAIYVVKDKRQSVFSESDFLTFTVVDGGRDLGTYMGKEPGYIKPKFEWIKQ